MQKDNWTSSPDSLKLERRHVDIWRISLNLTVDSVKLLFSSLSADETQRAIRFHFPADRDRFIAAHGILREILGRYLRYKPSELAFSVNQYGKPALVNSDLEFNLSHSGDFALLAITQGRKIGVDVERIRTNMELENIASHNFSRLEISELMALPPEQREIGFFNCWTRKEAYIKAHGLGLSLPLDSFDVSLSPDQPVIFRAARHNNSQESIRWTLCSLDINPNYAGALAVEGLDLSLRFWDWNLGIHI
jgi:4'-phosphopantetheinyl transferase